MTRADGLVHKLTLWGAERADGRAGRLAVAAWSAQNPLFDGYTTAGEMVRAGWVNPVLADELASALAAIDDRLAAQAALALLAPRLARIVARWTRAGVLGPDLDDLEADLVAETLVALRQGPGHRPPGGVVDTAWARVRSRRRRHRAGAARHDPLTTAAELAGPTGAPPAQTAAGLVVDAVRAGRLSITSAQAVYVTSVSGWPTGEAARRLGCRPTRPGPS